MVTDRSNEGPRDEAALSTRPLDTFPDLWTIGYEGRELGEFLRVLRSRKVKSLVDVRELPLSRRKGFSKSSLYAALAEEGINYLHLRALGSPRDLRHLYRAGGSRDEFMSEYSDYLSRQDDSLRILMAMIATCTLAIMCVESDYRDCHRSVIGQRLANRGLQVGHL
jgi:uncharacterized protein (DUF488 family)